MGACVTKERRAAVIRYLQSNPGATTREVRDGIEDVAEETARAILRGLVDAGLATVFRVGVTRHYTLTEGAE